VQRIEFCGSFYFEPSRRAKLAHRNHESLIRNF
jgi:hypothetical protein